MLDSLGANVVIDPCYPAAVVHPTYWQLMFCPSLNFMTLVFFGAGVERVGYLFATVERADEDEEGSAGY